VKNINKALYEGTGINKFQESFFSLERSMQRFGKSAVHVGGFDTVAKSAWNMVGKTGSAFAAVGSSFKGLLTTLGGSALLFGGASFGALEFFKHFSQDMVNISRSSERFGLKPQVFQGLQFAAEKAGIPVEKFDRMLRKLSVSTGHAFRGQGDALMAFSALGINVSSNGKVKGLDQVLGQVLDKLHGKSATFRNQVLSILVGTKGIELGNLIKFGSAGLKKEMARLKEVYGTLDPAAIERAEAFNSKWVDLSWALKGVRDAAGSELIPVITTLTTDLTNFFVTNRDK